MSAAPLSQAVTFDVGGTLLEPWPSVGHVYAEVASRHGWRDLLPESLNRQFAAAWRRMENFQHTRAEWEAIVDATFQGFTQPPPSQSFFPELYERFQQPDAWSLFED